MNGTTLAILIIISAIGAFLLYKWLKPYFIRHDSTITICGGIGSGKTLTGVKLAIVLIRRNRLFKYLIPNVWNKFINKCFKNPHNKRVARTGKGKIWKIKPMRKKPMLYSNFPIYYKPNPFKTDKEWSIQLEEEHILLLKEINEYSIVFLDEMPQFINQFNWDEELVQKNVNEFITFFRHYIGGYAIFTAQSINDIVVQIRRKLNQAIFCVDFKKWLFGLFYTIRMCDIMINDQMETISTSFIEDNTKLHFGLFPSRNTYDTRCYSERYKNILKDSKEKIRYKALKTNKILRLVEYISPLDDETTKVEKKQMLDKALKLSRKKVNTNGKER